MGISFENVDWLDIQTVTGQPVEPCQQLKHRFPPLIKQIVEIREALLTRADIRDNVASTTQAAVHRFEHKVDRLVLLHGDPTGLESLVLFIVGLVLSSAAAMA